MSPISMKRLAEDPVGTTMDIGMGIAGKVLSSERAQAIMASAMTSVLGERFAHTASKAIHKLIEEGRELLSGATAFVEQNFNPAALPGFAPVQPKAEAMAYAEGPVRGHSPNAVSKPKGFNI